MVDFEGLYFQIIKNLKYYGENIRKLFGAFDEVGNEINAYIITDYLNTFIGTDSTDGCADADLEDRFKWITEQGDLSYDDYRKVLKAVVKLKLEGFNKDNLINLAKYFTTDELAGSVDVYENSVSGNYYLEDDFTGWDIGDDYLGIGTIIGGHLYSNHYFELDFGTKFVDGYKNTFERILLEIKPLWLTGLIVYSTGEFLDEYSYVRGTFSERFERNLDVSSVSTIGTVVDKDNTYDDTEESYAYFQPETVNYIIGTLTENFTILGGETVNIEAESGIDNLALTLGAGAYTALQIITDLNNLTPTYCVFEDSGGKVKVSTTNKDEYGYVKTLAGTLNAIIGFTTDQQQDNDVNNSIFGLGYYYGVDEVWLNRVVTVRILDHLYRNAVGIDDDNLIYTQFGTSTEGGDLTDSIDGRERYIFDVFDNTVPIISSNAEDYVFASDEHFIVRVVSDLGIYTEDVEILANTYTRNGIIEYLNDNFAKLKAIKSSSGYFSITSISGVDYIEIVENDANSILGFTAGDRAYSGERFELDTVYQYFYNLKSVYLVDADSQIDSTVVSYNDCIMGLDELMQLVYYDVTNNKLRYSYSDGLAWNNSDVESGYGKYCRMKIDGVGDLHTLYTKLDDSEIHYAIYDGSSWSIESVVSGDSYYDVDLSIDLDGNIVISYRCNSGGNDELYFMKRTDGVWGSEVLVKDSVTDDVGFFSKIIVDLDGNLYIIDCNNTTADVDSNFSDDVGATWDNTNIASPDVCEDLDAVIDSVGKLHVAVVDSSQTELLYIQYDQRWLAADVIRSNNDSEVAIEIDDNDCPHIISADNSSNNMYHDYDPTGGTGTWIGVSVVNGDTYHYMSFGLTDLRNPEVIYQENGSSLEWLRFIIGDKDMYAKYYVDEVWIGTHYTVSYDELI